MTTVRPARAEDAPSLPAIERSAAAAFAALPDLAWIADDGVMPVERHLELAAAGDAWVAVDDADAPVGFLAAERIGDALHVWEIAVKHELQGRGIGRRLIARAVERARSRGLAEVTLTTFRDVPWNAPFYRRLGFREVEGAPSARLRALLDDEVARGLTRRCPMILRLDGAEAG